ncbi:MAG: hypothetical protein KJ620_05340 [Candidatus Edwardsbacteria bacterium]|nr:hypothetical protein [Candidatus Edwardsbacteria bacterium]MBU1577545.1 hypothetical protein [Candidatus Edwardsbacteria bacterium]MBU2462517.1 hypothetical protein [Candidatus Edwardsbacteria bacterium]MBU2593640.1 hypothetical protein [Candidatus Edwardsbacteria bacterium]
MNKNKKITSDLELFAILDKWQVEMPDQQFFANLPAVVQQAALKPSRPWWSAVLAPLPVTSFIMVAALAFGIATIQSRISSDNRISLTAAHWASEKYGWSNIDEALEAVAQDIPVSQNNSHEKYLSTLQKGTYLYGTDNAAQMLDELSETEMEYILSELQNTRS